MAGVIVAAVILGATSLALFGGTLAWWLFIVLSLGPLIGLLLANAGTGLNYYGIWRILRGLDEYSARDDALTGGASAISNLQGVPAAARAALGCGSLFSAGVLGVSLITAALSYLPGPLPHIGAGLPGGSPTATQIVQATATPFPTPTTIPTATPLPTATASPTPIPFTINSASAFNPASYSGLCATTRTFSINGTIFAHAGAPGGNVTFRWARSDGSFSPAKTIAFSAGQISRNITDSWTLHAAQGTGATYTDQIRVSAPNSLFSRKAAFTFGCQFVALSASTSVDNSDATCLSQVVFTGVITFSPSPGGPVTYYWERDDGNNQTPVTITVAPGATSVSVTDTWDLVGLPYGTHQDILRITAPNAIFSDPTTFNFGAC
jgi:hypothetical protein